MGRHVKEYDAVECDGKTYRDGGWFMKKYSIDTTSLKNARDNGLPFIVRERVYFYCERDFNDYFAGRIGRDV